MKFFFDAQLTGEGCEAGDRGEEEAEGGSRVPGRRKQELLGGICDGQRRGAPNPVARMI